MEHHKPLNTSRYVNLNNAFGNKQPAINTASFDAYTNLLARVMTNLSKASIYRSFIAEVSETLPGVKGAKESAKMNSDAEAKCFAPRKIFLPFELKFEKTIDKLLMLVILAPF